MHVMGNSGSDGSSLGRRLDSLPLNQLHIFIVLATGFGLVFDTLEASMTNVLATVFATREGMSVREVSMMLSTVFLGGIIGAPLAGHIADRIGRRMTLMIVLTGYGVLSITASFASSMGELAVLRFVTGMFLAPYPPLMWTYLADVLPPAARGRIMMLAGAAGSLGSTLAPYVAHAADGWLGFEGWQWSFAAGGLGGLVVAALALRLPESPRWLERVGRADLAAAELSRFEASTPLTRSTAMEAGEGTVTHSAPAPIAPSPANEFGRRLALLLALNLLVAFAVIGFVALSGVVLAQKGHDAHSSLLYMSLLALGAPLGAILASLVIDRFPRHISFSVGCLLMAALGLAFGIVESAEALVLIGGAYMVTVTILTMTLNIYGPEMFTTEKRAFASGLGYAANRLGAAIVPLALLPLLIAMGGFTMFVLIAAALLLAAVLVMVWGPRDVVRKGLR